MHQDAQHDNVPPSPLDSPHLPTLDHARLYELTRLLNAAIAAIGNGPYQLVVLIFGGGVYLAEGSFLLMLSIVAKSVLSQWTVSPMLAGTVAGVLFAGLIVGTLFGGLACDRFGRRAPIIFTYLGITVFTLMAILMPSLLLVLVAKFCLGFCLGFGLPAANAIVAESCPPVHRSNIYCMTMVLFSLGQLYAATIVWLLNPSLSHDGMSWRMMLAGVAMLPFLLLFLAYFFLLESPHWLMLHGRVLEAQNVLQVMLSYKVNDANQSATAFSLQSLQALCHSAAVGEGCLSRSCLGETIKEAADTDDEEQGQGTCRSQVQRNLNDVWDGFCRDCKRIRSLFTKSYRSTTLIMLYIAMAVNFAYYGLIYGLPGAFKEAHHTSESQGTWSPAAGLLVSAVSEIPGAFLAVALAATIGRRTSMSFALLGCAISMCFAVWALSSKRITDNVGLMSVFSVKVFLASGLIIMYLYMLECYPTKFRATGLAFIMVLGRVGAALVPTLYDGLDSDKKDDFFVMIAASAFIASVACCFLPYETRDTVLEEVAPPGTCTPAAEYTPLMTLRSVTPPRTPGTGRRGQRQ